MNLNQCSCETEKGRIFASRRDSTCFIRLDGVVRYLLSQEFDAYVEQSIAESADSRYIFDLRNTSGMDSTILGIVSKIGRACRNSSSLPLMVSPGKDVLPLLTSMGFERYFSIVSESDAPEIILPDADEYELISPLPGRARELSRRVLRDAHFALTEMNESLKEEFKGVLEGLK